MSIQKNNKLMSLIDRWTDGMVATSPWLREIGISRQLVQKYKKGGWISSIGQGAYKRKKEKISVYGAVYALQNQLDLAIHIAALSALNHQGVGHYVQMNEKRVFLFSDNHQTLPVWFRKYEWAKMPNQINTNFLATNAGIETLNIEGFGLRVSSVERAILETLYLTPKQMNLMEVYHIVEGLQTIRPSLVQLLLENCNSVKVKRLFLYMAHKANLPVVKYLKTDKISLGTGDRTIVPKGKYVSQYGLILPHELVNDD